MDSVSIAVQTKKGEVLSVEIPRDARVQHLETHIRENVGEDVGGMLCQNRLLNPDEKIMDGMGGSSCVLHCIPENFAAWFREGHLSSIPGEVVLVMPFLHRSDPCLFVINRVVWFALRKIQTVEGKLEMKKVGEAFSLDDAKKKVYTFL
uniref:Ubiquitin-like domain-containing protein n=1 Tax=Paramoeba aestuarina TaxID=180227 RepID=A0A7S4NX52_9EUKA|mmetsp:Transcript_31066/g.48435  ORF Transcript_31066/g.48435 Transcript_31066/m.48435 type:complete len:149 (+) Transcript_31066:66-512(+)